MAQIEVKVPQLSESVAEATLLSWHKKVGEAVARDENMIDIETDKVVLELPAPAAGVVVQVIKADGATVVAGEVIAIIDTEAAAGATPSAPAAAAAPAAAPAAAASVDKSGVAMPAAAKILSEAGIAASDVAGSGKDGRVTKGDALAAAAAPKPAAPAPLAPAAPKAQLQKVAAPAVANLGDRPEERVPMSRLRARIAERLVESQSTNAILTTFNEVDMKPVMDLRNKYKDIFEKKHGVKLGFMGFFTKAVTHALKELPAVNAEIDGTDVIYKNYCHVGMAVGTDKGLVVPVIRDADQMSIAEVEKELGRLAKAARDGSLSMADMQGGTFTITNGGVYGSLMSSPILNAPQSGILGMHKIQERPVAIGGQVVIRPMMYLALSYDHRIVDGKEAVTFLVRVKESLEDPERLVLDL